MSRKDGINFSEVNFVKLLVVSDKLERDRASRKFEKWAGTLDRMSLADGRKLWKALFYGNSSSLSYV
jgi:hypothetical protein